MTFVLCLLHNRAHLSWLLYAPWPFRNLSYVILAADCTCYFFVLSLGGNQCRSRKHGTWWLALAYVSYHCFVLLAMSYSILLVEHMKSVPANIATIEFILQSFTHARKLLIQLFAFHLTSIFQTCTSCLFWFFFCYGFWVALSKTNLQNFIFMVVVKEIVPRLRLLLSRSPLFVGDLEQHFLPQSFTMRWLHTSFF